MTDTEINGAIARKLGYGKDALGYWMKTEKWGWQGHREVPDFCHSIAAAWEIVEHMVERGFSITVQRVPTSRKWLKPPYLDAPAEEWTLTTMPNETSQCRVSCYDGDGKCWIVVTDPVAGTAPMAICLAFLKLETK